MDDDRWNYFSIFSTSSSSTLSQFGTVNSAAFIFITDINCLSLLFSVDDSEDRFRNLSGYFASTMVFVILVKCLLNVSFGLLIVDKPPVFNLV